MSEVWIKWTSTGEWQKVFEDKTHWKCRNYAMFNCSTGGGRIQRIEIRQYPATTGECVFDLSWVGHQPMA